MPDLSDCYSYTTLRTKVYKKLEEWGVVRGRSIALRLLLRNECGTFYEAEYMNDEEVRLCEALLGPHGYTVYKMLLAQREGVR
jgi:hypothetical protein